MSRYVKADMIGCPCGYCEGYDECQKEVDEAPSIDIVFCKDCKHRYDDGWLEPRWTCDYLKDMRLKDDDFCSYGERKESE